MTRTQLTLVTGGTGKTGRRVVERLREEKHSLRIGSRSAQQPFDWNQAETWPAAVQGVHAVYISYHPDLTFPGAAEAIRAFVKVAVDSGVRRLVLLSGRGDPGAHESEQTVRQSGVEWTIVRSSWFCQNFSEDYLLEPVLSGEVAFPAASVAEPFIDVDDIAEIASAALTDARHAGKLYEVTGPRLLTFADAVAEIAHATGRAIRYVPVTPQEYASALLGQGLPAMFVNPLVDLFATVLDGRNAHVDDGVQQALGRAPRDFTDYAQRTAATGVWDSSRVTAGV